MDKDLERFRSYEVFKHYVKKRFSLRLLHQKGEQSFVRRMYVKTTWLAYLSSQCVVLMRSRFCLLLSQSASVSSGQG